MFLFLWPAEWDDKETGPKSKDSTLVQFCLLFAILTTDSLFAVLYVHAFRFEWILKMLFNLVCGDAHNDTRKNNCFHDYVNGRWHETTRVQAAHKRPCIFSKCDRTPPILATDDRRTSIFSNCDRTPSILATDDRPDYDSCNRSIWTSWMILPYRYSSLKVINSAHKF